LDFVELKQAIEGATGMTQDALHIYGAVLIQLGAAALSRRGVGHPLPWLCVLAVELVNEWADLRFAPVVGATELWAGLHDIWNTMLLPTVLLLLARTAPWLFRPGRSMRSTRHRSDQADRERLAKDPR
jgi:hypothetical protein